MRSELNTSINFNITIGLLDYNQSSVLVGVVLVGVVLVGVVLLWGAGLLFSEMAGPNLFKFETQLHIQKVKRITLFMTITSRSVVKTEGQIRNIAITPERHD